MSTKIQPSLDEARSGEITSWVRIVWGVALERFKGEEGWHAEMGGCCAIGHPITRKIQYKKVLGTVSEEERVHYETAACEQIKELAARHGQKGWDGKDSWEGAIVAERVIISFFGVGMPQMGCQAVALVIAVRTKELSFCGAEVIANMSENPYFAQLHEAVEKSIQKATA